MRKFSADYYSMLKDIEQFRIYRCQVNEFIGQLEKINSQNMIIGLTQEFIGTQQKIIYNYTIDKYFFKDFNSLLAVFPSNYSDTNRLKKLIKILLEQQIERYWYRNYPVYENDVDVDNDKELYDLVDRENIISNIIMLRNISCTISFKKTFHTF